MELITTLIMLEEEVRAKQNSSKGFEVLWVGFEKKKEIGG